MKRKLLIAAITIIIVLIILAIFNTLQFYMGQSDLAENIDQTYFQPRIVSEIQKLNPDLEDRSYAVDSEKISTTELIEKNSAWVLEFADLTILREEWHFKMYDYIKSVKPGGADQILKKYFELKQDEISKLESIDNHFKNEMDQILEENNGEKNNNYYKAYHSAMKQKKEETANVRGFMRTEKINLFGRYYPSLMKLNEGFHQNVDQRLMREHNMKSEEIKHLRENSIKDGDKLIYLSL